MIACFCCCILWKFHKRNVKAKHDRANQPIEIIDVDKNPEAAASLIAQFGGNPDEVLAMVPTKAGGPVEKLSPEDEELAAQEAALEAELAEEERKLQELEDAHDKMTTDHEATMYKLTKNFLGRLSSDTAEREKAKLEALEAGEPSRLKAAFRSSITSIKQEKKEQMKSSQSSISEEPALASAAQPPPYEEPYQSTSILAPAADGGKNATQPSERV